jgi:hypothetical protein
MAAPVDTTVDYLEEDTIVPQGQRFALVSFVGPEQRQKNEKLGMKIRGCFTTREEAAAHVKKLQAFDGSVDIFMLEVGKWALIPPSIEDMEDVEYQEKYLNDLMKDYKESQLKAKEIFNQRTEAVKKDGVDAHLLPSEVLPQPEGVPELKDITEELEKNEASGSGSK